MPGSKVEFKRVGFAGNSRETKWRTRRRCRTLTPGRAGPTDWHRCEVVAGTNLRRSASPLGLVMWIDNQYAVASETGDFRFGLIPHPEERWMDIQDFSIT